MKKTSLLLLISAFSFQLSEASPRIHTDGLGLHIGETAADKIGAYGVTPVAQQAATVSTRTAIENLGFVATGGTGGTATASSGAATLSKLSGTVTSEALTTAAAAAYTLTVTNTLCATTSIIHCSVDNGTNTQGIPVVGIITPGTGSFVVKIYNLHATQALNGTIKVRFTLAQ